jgi:isocitrate/isopropylmalate dehydrogenase
LPLLLPAVDLLESVSQNEPAGRIRNAMEMVLSEGKLRTPDLGGNSTTTEIASAIVRSLS